MNRLNGHFSKSPDLMVQSDPDIISLAQAVEDRFLDLCGAYLRIKGSELPIPETIQKAFYRWRELRIRHKKGDFRNTMSERKAVREIAEWTVRENALLRNQKVPVIEWKD